MTAPHSPQPADLARAARGVLARSWVAIPLRANHKRPLTDGWRNDPELRATSIDDQDHYAWGRGGPWSGCNVGILVEESGLIVLDPDVKAGHDGIANLRSLLEEKGLDPDQVLNTYTVRTPSGGRHYYFRVVGRGSWRGKLCEGVDVKHNGLVVAAGSYTVERLDDEGKLQQAEGYYEVENDTKVRQLPAELADLLSRDPNSRDGEQRMFTEAQADRFVRAEGLDKLREAGPGERNIQLNNAACVVGHFVPEFIESDEAEAALMEVAEEIGLVMEDGEEQCRKTIQSGLRKGQADWKAERADEEDTESEVESRVAEMRLRDQAQRAYDRERFPFAAALADKHFTHGEALLAKYTQFQGERVRFLVEGVLKERSYGALGAEYKAGKTWLLLDLMVSIATGVPWLGYFKVAEPAKVAYMLGEGQEDEFFRRLEAICEFREVPIQQVLRNVSLQVGSSNMSDPAQMERIYADLAAFRPALVVVDPWYLSAGEVDGKNIVVAGKVLDNIAGMARSLESALMIAQHWNKTGQGAGTARWAGSGLQEWARFMVNVSTKKYTGAAAYSKDQTGQTVSELQVDLSGEISGSFRVDRTVWTDDARKAESAMHYTAFCRELSDEEVEEEKATVEQQLIRVVKEKGEPLTRMEILRAAGCGSGRKYQEAGPIFDRLTVGTDSPLIESHKIRNSVYWTLRNK